MASHGEVPHTTSSAPPSQSTIRTRRRGYLAQTPTYLISASEDLEISHPIRYDKWVRRWQSADERQREGQSRGVAGALERGVARGEAAAAARTEKTKPARAREGGSHSPRAAQRAGKDRDHGGVGTSLRHNGAEDLRSDEHGREVGAVGNGTVDGDDDSELLDLNADFEDDRAGEEDVMTKVDGLHRWHAFIRHRFLSGKDDDFDYSTVDNNDAYDDLDDERQKAEDAWFGDESAEFVLDDKGRVEGETGVQDF
ncbi:hypothetical protein LTR95_006515 [Oleoguttula sp. CCFEE 5521]